MSPDDSVFIAKHLAAERPDIFTEDNALVLVKQAHTFLNREGALVGDTYGTGGFEFVKSEDGIEVLRRVVDCYEDGYPRFVWL